MSTSSIVKQLDALTRDQILAIRPGSWSDLDLLEPLKHFEKEKKDRDCAMAVAELILRSPQVGNVDYLMLYLDVTGYYRWKHDFPAALRWAHSLIAFSEQHGGDLNRANHIRDLAETYLQAGDLDTGLALFTRLAQASPGDIWSYNSLGFGLPRAGLPRLALEVLDYALKLVAKNDPEQLKKQLADQRRKVEETLSSAPDRTGDISPDVLAGFRAALLQPVLPRRKRSTRHGYAASYLSPITRLLDAGPAGDATIEAEILTQGKVLIPELIRLAFDEEMPADGAPAHAVRLLRQLRGAQAAELGELSAWLDRANGDWRNELLTRRCAKIGGYTTSELEAIVADTQSDTFTRTSALEAVAERVERLPALRERVVAFMRTMLTRPEADTAGEEMIVGFLIGDALDLDARELYPEIERAFVEDRVDTSIISPLDVQHHWGQLPAPEPEHQRRDGMYMRLRCAACDRVREHFVQNVLLDLNTIEQLETGQPVDNCPYIMDHEIVCPKCGAVDRYDMTPGAHTAMLVLANKMDDLVALFAGEKTAADLPPNPRVHPFRSSVFQLPMHPLAGLEEYRRRIAAHPKDAKLYMRMGTLLRTLYRHSAALESHRQAYALNPNDAEIALVCAMSEHDFGDRAVAKTMYERVLTLELKGSPWGIVRSNTFAGAAMEGLDLLKKHQPSPWALPAYDPTTDRKTMTTVETLTPDKPSRKRRRRRDR